jgi:ATP-dependent DNA helicase RecQ
MKFDERTISRVSKYLENQNQLKRNNFNLFWIMFRIKGMQNKLILHYFVKKRMSIVNLFLLHLKQAKDTSLASAIVTLLQSENLNSRDTKQD